MMYTSCALNLIMLHSMFICMSLTKQHGKECLQLVQTLSCECHPCCSCKLLFRCSEKIIHSLQEIIPVINVRTASPCKALGLYQKCIKVHTPSDAAPSKGVYKSKQYFPTLASFLSSIVCTYWTVFRHTSAKTYR